MRLIDADALKENMRGEFIDSVEERIAIREIDSAPTIEPKRGEWLWDDGHFCSECREYAEYNAVIEKEVLSNFCPNCGAKMK